MGIHNEWCQHNDEQDVTIVCRTGTSMTNLRDACAKVGVCDKQQSMNSIVTQHTHHSQHQQHLLCIETCPRLSAVQSHSVTADFVEPLSQPRTAVSPLGICRITAKMHGPFLSLRLR